MAGFQKGCLCRGDLLNDLHPIIIRQCWQGRRFHSLTRAEWHQLRFLWRKTSALSHLFSHPLCQHGPRGTILGDQNFYTVPRVRLWNLRKGCFFCLKSCFASAAILIRKIANMLNQIAALEDTNRAVISVPSTIVGVWSELPGLMVPRFRWHRLMAALGNFQDAKWKRSSLVRSDDYTVLIRGRCCMEEPYLYKTTLKEHLHDGLSCWKSFWRKKLHLSELWFHVNRMRNFMSVIPDCLLSLASRMLNWQLWKGPSWSEGITFSYRGVVRMSIHKSCCACLLGQGSLMKSTNHAHDHAQTASL